MIIAKKAGYISRCSLYERIDINSAVVSYQWDTLLAVLIV
jgi:hypothetical protein